MAPLSPPPGYAYAIGAKDLSFNPRTGESDSVTTAAVFFGAVFPTY